MIVLTRRIGEALMIETPSGELVEITILDAQGHRVRIGASASKNVKIIREEALERQNYVTQ